MRIALLDYGIGGLGILQLVRDYWPQADLIYFSDAGRLPYGQMTAAQLNARITDLAVQAARMGAGHLVIACHAASTAISHIQSPIPVTGMQTATLAAVPQKPHLRVGILGGGRTVEEGYYQLALQKRGFAVAQVNAQQLSILAEAGEVSGPVVERAVRVLLDPLLPLDLLLLACTHYPALSPVFRKVMPARCQLIDPAAQLLQQLQTVLPASLRGEGTTVYYSSGSAEMMVSAARAAWGLELHVSSIGQLN